MQEKIINGKEISDIIKQKLLLEIKDLKLKTNKIPKLVVILVGENPASKIYVKNKYNMCLELGIESEIIKLDKKISCDELIEIIKKLNNDENVNGILVQLPLSKHIDENKIIEVISPKKDVDCFHPINLGYLFSGNNRFLPCTPSGIIQLLKYKNIEISGKNVVIIGRSNIVGKPLFNLFLQNDATVTICHSKTKNLINFTKNADILVVVIGKPLFLKKDLIKDNAVIIDVGINRVDGKVVGDVDFDDVIEKVKFITPVPGGVGKMTIITLMQNTLFAFKLQNNLI